MKRVVFALFCAAIAAAWLPAAAHALSWSDVAAYWPFDETSTTNPHFYDASGNGNHATFGVPRAATTAGLCASLDASYATRSGARAGTGAGLQFGYACPVDGTVMTPVVDVPETAMPTLADNFAISFWLDAGVGASEYGVLASYNDDATMTGREWTVGIDNVTNTIPGALTIGCRSSSGTQPAQYSTSLGGVTGYHHYIAQFTGENVTALYVDGQPVANTNVAAWYAPSAKGFVLGARERATLAFPPSGVVMDDFALIDASLTAANADAIYANYTAGNDLTALAGTGGILEGKLNTYFKLNETTGSAVADSSGNAHTGDLRQWSLCEPKPVSDATVAGQFGAAAEFNSTLKECCQVIPSTLPAVGSEAFTTTFWLKLADWSSGGDVITWDNEKQTQFNVVVGSGGTNAGRLYVYVNSPTDGTKKSWVVLDEGSGGENLTNGQFAHFAIVVDADSNVSYYVNGNPVAVDGTGTAYDPTCLNTTFMGARAAAGYGAVNTLLPGVLDDLAVFKGALTQTQIQDIMARGVATAIPEPGALALLLGALAVWGLRQRREIR
jgi:hypothetical protein